MITINISAFLFHGLSAPLSVPPFFLKKPLDKIIANESDSLTLLCLVGGTPEPEVEWFKHGAPIPFERASVFPGSRLTVTTVVPDDSGRYQCSSANSVGQLHHVFEVTIKRKNRFFCRLQIHHSTVYIQLSFEHHRETYFLLTFVYVLLASPFDNCNSPYCWKGYLNSWTDFSKEPKKFFPVSLAFHEQWKGRKTNLEIVLNLLTLLTHGTLSCSLGSSLYVFTCYLTRVTQFFRAFIVFYVVAILLLGPGR